MEKKLSIEELATFCKKKGFAYRTAEIYGGLSGFFDFGPLGVSLKDNLKKEYIKEFVLREENIFMQDSAIITNPKVWEASGHLETFGDLMLTTKKTKTKIRADHFIEENLKISAEGLNSNEIMNLIKKHNLTYQGEEFEDINLFKVMFDVKVGADTTKDTTAYLRPETAQNIFINFKQIAEVSRAKLPFGIAQIGKAFRNEISPRDFLFRCREFEQIELEYFYNPRVDKNYEFENFSINVLFAKEQEVNSNETKEIKIKELINNGLLNSAHIYWISKFIKFLIKNLGIDIKNLRLREHIKTELSHYSSATFDIEYNFPMGFKELIGIANRGNFDLIQHKKHSKEKFEIFDERSKEKLVPYVIEPSVGFERLFLATIYEAYNDDKKRGNVVLEFEPKISPISVCVFPLMNKEELFRTSREIFNELINLDIRALFDKGGSIGRRYARADEIGVPYCITIDYETIEDEKLKGTVTIRDRDSREQKRIKIENLIYIISDLLNKKIKFSDL